MQSTRRSPNQRSCTDDARARTRCGIWHVRGDGGGSIERAADADEPGGYGARASPAGKELFFVEPAFLPTHVAGNAFLPPH